MREVIKVMAAAMIQVVKEEDRSTVIGCLDDGVVPHHGSRTGEHATVAERGRHGEACGIS
jgi:hypothetical protein